MSESNRRFLLRQRPSGRVDDSTFELGHRARRPRSARARRSSGPSTSPSIRPTGPGSTTCRPTCPRSAIGEVVRAAGIGRVVSSNNPAFEEGKLYQGLIGWQDWFVASDSMPLIPVTEVPGVESPSAYLGVLGMTGLTAWVGIHEIGKPKEGETVVVSAAAGRGRLGRGSARQVLRRAGRRDRRRTGEVRAADRPARLRRRRRLQGRRLAGEARRGDSGRHRRRLRERRRRDHGADLRAPQPERPRRPVRTDLRLQRRRAAARPAHPRQRPHEAGADQGLHRPRPLPPGG